MGYILLKSSVGYIPRFITHFFVNSDYNPFFKKTFLTQYNFPNPNPNPGGKPPEPPVRYLNLPNANANPEIYGKRVI